MALTYEHVKASSDSSAISSNNTWVDGPSLSLSAGTWLVFAQITLIKTATTLVTWQARITDNSASTHYASGQLTSPSNNPQGGVITLATVITLTSATTIKVQATTSAGAASSAAIRAATSANSSGNNATQLTALKVA